jgi:hypothetical protein
MTSGRKLTSTSTSNDRGMHITELLPLTAVGNALTETQIDGKVFMIYVVDMGASSMIYIPSLIKMDYTSENKQRDTQVHRQPADRM